MVGLAVAGLPANLKISAAAVIDPNSSTVKTPIAILPAGRVAMLLYQPHPTPRIRRAIVPVHVVRRARDNLSLAVPVVAAIRIIVAVTIPIMVPILATSAPFDREIGTAAVIHPNAPAVRAPTVAFPAGRFATLLDEPNSALCIG
jgi:hypothetical protein